MIFADVCSIRTNFSSQILKYFEIHNCLRKLKLFEKKYGENQI